LNRLDHIIADLKGPDSTAEILRTISQAAAMVMVTMNGNPDDVEPFTILWSTPTADTLFGYLPGELPGKKLEVLIPSRLRAVHTIHTAGFSDHPKRRSMGQAGSEVVGQHREGGEIQLQISLVPTMHSGLRVAVAVIIESRPEQSATGCLVRHA
jgi:hypothetical protein